MTAEVPLSTALRAAARNCDKLLVGRLNHLGLTGPRLELLAVYAENPGTTNAEAAAYLDTSTQTAHFITSALIDKGWVTVGTAAGRRLPITVTDAGLEVLDAAWDATRPVEKRLATLLGASGIRRLRQTAGALAEGVTVRNAKPNWIENPQHVGLSNAALGLHCRALAWANDNRCDVIPKQVVRRWTSPQANIAGRLVDAGMWKPDGDDGWRVR
jgi:DNA-binding MarR family transcriptional regulator